ncbi:MAG: hypothetical protein ACP5U2_13715 [Bryobacteraceae bacterium]
MSQPPDPVPVETPARVPRFVSVTRLLAGLARSAVPFVASLVLLLYPWMERWERNRFATWLPVWSSGYLRGAVSGLGAVSLSLSLGSLVRLRRKPR